MPKMFLSEPGREKSEGFWRIYSDGQKESPRRQTSVQAVAN